MRFGMMVEHVGELTHQRVHVRQQNAVVWYWLIDTASKTGKVDGHGLSSGWYYASQPVQMINAKPTRPIFIMP